MILGLATYGVSFGPVVDGNGATGWYVRFAALAGLVAALCLLPRGKPFPAVVGVLAAMGFLDGLSILITADTGWAMTTIVVLNALQTAAAVAALLLGRNAEATGAANTDYAAYVDYYNRAVRDYYSQQLQSPSDQSTSAGRGQGYADAQATAQIRRTQRPSQHADYAELDHPAAHPSAPARREPGAATPATGMPRIGHTQRSAQRPQEDTSRSTWPDSPS